VTGHCEPAPQTGHREMQYRNRLLNAAVAGLALAVALAFAGNVRAEDYGPLYAAQALREMPALCRTLGLGCPISADAYAAKSTISP
jgi:hypothetical protein